MTKTTINIKPNALNKIVMLILSLLTAEEAKKGSQSKMLYAVKRWNEKKEDFDKLVAEEATEINMRLASTDQNGLLQRETDGAYKFSLENEIQRTKELKELYERKFPFNPYLFTSDPERVAKFGLYEREELAGIFIEGDFVEEEDAPKADSKKAPMKKVSGK
jgi:hypothetical protein